MLVGLTTLQTRLRPLCDSRICLSALLFATLAKSSQGNNRRALQVAVLLSELMALACLPTEDDAAFLALAARSHTLYVHHRLI